MLRRKSFGRSSGGTSSDDTKSQSLEYEVTDSGNANMKVVVRVRPESNLEIHSSCQTVVKVLDNHVLIFDPKEDNLPSFDHSEQARRRKPFLSRKPKDLRFAFDRIFDGYSTQQEVFEHTTKSIIDGLLDGVNCSVFAYGATGAGKTHTMLGTQDKPGVMFLTTMELYKRIDELKHEKSCQVAVSYLEVYNETIRDLLVPSGALAVREDSSKGLVVSGLTQHQPKSAEDLLHMLESGNKNRTQHPTDANATSSRSHAVFQVFVNQKARSAGLTAEVTQGKMSLIDLAGSERATVTTNRGDRLREGANINKSLLALGNCINALASSKGKTGHVPYRNSKLTRLLKDSLGGSCRTVMIANISPSGLSFEDTYNTLKYADRAKQIKTKLVRNVVNVDFHVARYRTIVNELQKEVSELKARLDMVEPAKHPVFNTTEANRLQSLLQGVYGERGRLRKGMADLDASERDTLLRIYRKERDLHRIEVFTGTDSKISKVKATLDYLHGHLKDLKERKTSLHRELSHNNESIGRALSEINRSTNDTDNSSPLQTYIDKVTEVCKLETESIHQWKQIKHLLKYIKNQEKDTAKTEKLLTLSLELSYKQHQLLQATSCVTPMVQDLYDSLVRLTEGEKEVLWADQDSLMETSVMSVTHSQQAVLDSLIVHDSSVRKPSRYSSPSMSASLGLLKTGTTTKTESTGDRTKSDTSPFTPTAKVPTSPRLFHPATPTGTSGTLAGKVLSMPITSPKRKKRICFTPPPITLQEIDEVEEKVVSTSPVLVKSPEAIDFNSPRRASSTNNLTHMSMNSTSETVVSQKDKTSSSYCFNKVKSLSQPVSESPNIRTPVYRRTHSASTILNHSVKENINSTFTVSPAPHGRNSKHRINLAELTSIKSVSPENDNQAAIFVSPHFEDNFVPSQSFSNNHTPVRKSVSSGDSHDKTTPTYKLSSATNPGPKQPFPIVTPQQSTFLPNTNMASSFNSAFVPSSNPNLGGSPATNLPQQPPQPFTPTRLTGHAPSLSQLVSPFASTGHLTSPLSRKTSPHSPTQQKFSEKSYQLSVIQKNSQTYIQSPLALHNNPSKSLNSTFTKPPPHEVPAVFQKKSHKDVKLVSPMSTSTAENRHDKAKSNKKLPSYLSLTKSATFKRVQHSGATTKYNVQKENHPLSRSHSFKNKGKIICRSASNRSQSISTAS